ncbi:MAG: Ger(x)C family spore germination protein [Firmicutes bacterium]|nr:Ger(x)C family spore germination protein [Bacillota bacterium]
MNCKRLLALLIIAALAGTLSTGCWNRREPELLGVVLAVGFDYDEESGSYQIFAQLANPVAMGGSGGESSSGSGGGGGEKAFWTIEAKGPTPFAAVRNLIGTSSRALFWPHCRVLLLSEKVARQGVAEIFDLFERGRQFRLIVKPAVVQGDLQKIMKASFPLEETGARGLDRLVLTTRFDRSIFPEKNLNELIATHAQTGKEMLIGRLEVLETADEGAGDGGSSPPPARLCGSALFRGDRMVGWASAKQVQGWTYGSGRVFRSTLLVALPAEENRHVSIETYSHTARMSLHGDEENWWIEMKVKLHGRIQEFDGPGKLDAENKLTHSLERRAAQAVRNDIEAMFNRSQELRADIFGFGNLIYRKNPQLWQQIRSRWDEEIFPQLKVELTVEFDILHTGMVKDSLRED